MIPSIPHLPLEPEFAWRDFLLPAASLEDMAQWHSVDAALPLASAQATAEQNAAIAAGLQRQDPGLLDQLIETYQHRLLRYLIFLTGRRELAEDLFQDVWMRVLERGRQFNGRSKFETWLFTIARNMVIDQSRRKSLASLDALEAGERPYEVVSGSRSPLQNAQSGQVASNVGKALARLDRAHREVLVLRFHEELTLEEIAQLTRAPLSTVKSRLYRGMAALKPRLQAAGFTGQEAEV